MTRYLVRLADLDGTRLILFTREELPGELADLTQRQTQDITGIWHWENSDHLTPLHTQCIHHEEIEGYLEQDWELFDKSSGTGIRFTTVTDLRPHGPPEE